MFYDAISDKTLIKRPGILKGNLSLDEQVQKVFRKHFFKTASRIKAIESPIYNLFVFLVMRSSIHKLPIKTEYFKNLEQRENRPIKQDRPRSAEGS